MATSSDTIIYLKKKNNLKAHIGKVNKQALQNNNHCSNISSKLAKKHTILSTDTVQSQFGIFRSNNTTLSHFTSNN